MCHVRQTCVWMCTVIKSQTFINGGVPVDGIPFTPSCTCTCLISNSWGTSWACCSRQRTSGVHYIHTCIHSLACGLFWSLCGHLGRQLWASSIQPRSFVILWPEVLPSQAWMRPVCHWQLDLGVWLHYLVRHCIVSVRAWQFPHLSRRDLRSWTCHFSIQVFISWADKQISKLEKKKLCNNKQQQHLGCFWCSKQLWGLHHCLLTCTLTNSISHTSSSPSRVLAPVGVKLNTQN